MTTTKGGKLAALVIGAGLLAGACSSDKKASITTSATIVPTSAAGTPTSEAGTASSAASVTTDAGVATTDSAAGTTSGGGDDSGGSITYAAEQEYTSYNNLSADQVLFANTLELNLIQPSVFVTNPDLTYSLDENMMESVEVTQKDPQVITYKVKPEAVWQDGDPIDCDDFYLSWMSQNGTAGNQVDASGAEVKDDDGNPIPVFNAAGTVGNEDISTLTCSDDDRTITTTYDKQYVDYKNLFLTLMPAHVVEKVSGVADLTKATDPDIQKIADVWNEGFLGFDPERALSGLAYKVESFTPGETMILVRNEAYYGPPGKADEIIFRQVPDAAQQPTALGAGDVQVISPQPNPDLLAQLQGLDGIKSEVDQGITFEHIDFNQANPILADINIRKAIAHCIDRQEIVDTLVKPLNPDASVLNNHIYIPSQPQYVDNGGEYATRDVALAKQLIEKSGWVLGSDGVYAKDGQQLSLRLGRRDPNPRRQSTNELIAKQCAEAGIKLTDDPAEDFNAVRLPASDYDIALFAWIATPALSSNTPIYVPGGGQNWNNYSNDQLQGLFDSANTDFDEDSRTATMNKIDKILFDDMATLPLFQFQDLVAYSDNISNVEYNGTLGVTWNAQEWTVSS